jgi:hypothetical protein
MTTHKQQFNKRYGFTLTNTHSIQELSKLTGIPLKILNELNNRGKRAWTQNIKSVKKKETIEKPTNKSKLSANQWGMARIYAFINKLHKGTTLNNDADLGEKIAVVDFV